MREIKFRGKREDNGEWIYGYYFKSDGKEYITMPHPETKYADYVIKKGTGTQFIGLLDKQGKEIYEGDIVKVGEDVGKVIFTKYDDSEGYVDFSHIGWIIEYITNDRNTLTDVECEVIGNIYEHPELLEVK